MQAKAIAIALAVSLAVNFALIGYLAGERGGPGPAFDPTRGFAGWLRALPEARRDALRPMLREHRREGRVMLRDLRAHNQTLIEALEAETFSEATLVDALGRLRAHQNAAYVQSHKAFAALMGKLTLEERRLVAGELKRPRRLRGKAHGRPPPPPPPGV